MLKIFTINALLKIFHKHSIKSDKVKFQSKTIRQRSIFYTDKSMVYKEAISALNLFVQIKKN